MYSDMSYDMIDSEGQSLNYVWREIRPNRCLVTWISLWIINDWFHKYQIKFNILTIAHRIRIKTYMRLLIL